MCVASSCAAGAREVLKGDMKRERTERSARASTSESSRGSPTPSETDAPQLRSAGRRASSWASQSTASKAGPGIPATSASTAARSCPPPRRSTSTSGDALRGRRKQLLNRKFRTKSQSKNLPEGGPVQGALQPTDLCRLVSQRHACDPSRNV